LNGQSEAGKKELGGLTDTGKDALDARKKKNKGPKTELNRRTLFPKGVKQQQGGETIKDLGRVHSHEYQWGSDGWGGAKRGYAKKLPAK